MHSCWIEAVIFVRSLYSFDTQSHKENQGGLNKQYPPSTNVALAVSVHRSSAADQRTAGSLSFPLPRPPFSTARRICWIWDTSLSYWGDSLLISMDCLCSQRIQAVLLQSSKICTLKCCRLKWMRIWCLVQDSELSLSQVGVSAVSEYLLHLKSQGLTVASLKVPLAAVSASQILMRD